MLEETNQQKLNKIVGQVRAHLNHLVEDVRCYASKDPEKLTAAYDIARDRVEKELEAFREELDKQNGLKKKPSTRR